MVFEREKPRVVVLGGGFGALEAAFYLRKRVGDAADITLISDRDTFLFKPNLIYVPFGLDPLELSTSLAEPMQKKNIQFVQATARDVNPLQRVVTTNDGQAIPYEYLVIATGAAMRPGEIPGLAEHAQTVWTPAEMLRLRGALEQLIERVWNGKHQDALFLVPPNNRHATPLYELMFMFDTWLRNKNLRYKVDITLATCETTFLQAFGSRLHDTALDEFEYRNIVAYRDFEVERVEANSVWFANGSRLPCDLLVSFPPFVAAAQFASLPTDERGFIRAEEVTRQVVGHPNIYAVGDAANFGLKQAFLALAQADAAGEHLAGEVLHEAPRFGFEPMSMAVLEHFDTATFAQVPMATEDGLHVLENSPLYKVGTSPAWRLGKKALGVYLPRQFSAGEPLHAGLPWRGMEGALKVMSGMLAH